MNIYIDKIKWKDNFDVEFVYNILNLETIFL